MSRETSPLRVCETSPMRGTCLNINVHQNSSPFTLTTPPCIRLYLIQLQMKKISFCGFFLLVSPRRWCTYANEPCLICWCGIGRSLLSASLVCLWPESVSLLSLARVRCVWVCFLSLSHSHMQHTSHTAHTAHQITHNTKPTHTHKRKTKTHSFSLSSLSTSLVPSPTSLLNFSCCCCCSWAKPASIVF